MCCSLEPTARVRVRVRVMVGLHETHTDTHTRAHTHIRAHTRTHMHALTHARIRTHSRTHTSAQGFWGVWMGAHSATVEAVFADSVESGARSNLYAHTTMRSHNSHAHTHMHTSPFTRGASIRGSLAHDHTVVPTGDTHTNTHVPAPVHAQLLSASCLSNFWECRGAIVVDIHISHNWRQLVRVMSNRAGPLLLRSLILTIVVRTLLAGPSII